MDMGDILNQWESIQSEKKHTRPQNQVSHKKANAPSLEEKARSAEMRFEKQLQQDNSKKVNMMELWLRRYGTVDKDKIAEEQEERSKY